MYTSAISVPSPNKTFYALVDEFVALYNRLAPELDRYEALKKLLAAEANADKTPGPVTLAGYTHFVDYTAPNELLVCNTDPESFIDQTSAWTAVTVSVTEARKLGLLNFFHKKQGSRRFRRVR
jgi:hypothetical protein